MNQASDQPTRNFIASWWHRRQQRIEALSREVPMGEGPYFVGRFPLVILLVLTMIGAFATGFLSYRHILLASHSDGVGESALCKAVGRISCDAILLTDYSLLFGYFPSAVLGLMGCVFVLWCLINGLANERLRKLVWTLLVLYFSAAIGFSWYYLYVMAFEVDYICPWCLVVHAVNILSLIIVLVVAIKCRRKFLLPELAVRAERFYFALGGVTLSVIIFLGASLLETHFSFRDAKKKYESLANDPIVMMALLNGSPDLEIPITPEDPVYGRADAEFPIVVFSDFQCPGCAETEKLLKRLVDVNPEHLKLVYKNFPLSMDCNTVVLGNLHPAACPAARAAYAAFILGGSKVFWAYADLLFAHQKKLRPESLTAFAQELNLRQEQFVSLMGSDSVTAQKVADDIKLGTTLGVASTPDVFFAGKRISSNFKGRFFVDALEGLVREKYPNRTALQLHWR